MSSPDAENASPSPEYSPDPDESDMAVDTKTESQRDDASPASKPESNAKNAKDPLRPRRKKARRACLACQRAHLTCSDERPCGRCIGRNIQDGCMDGVRKKAKYLHDAPDAALMPGVGGHYPHLNGSHQAPQSGHDPHGHPGATPYYSQAPSAAYFPDAPAPVSVQDGPYSHPQAPISPPYSQTNQNALPSAPTTVPPGAHMQQFGGPLFDPSDPALFNFDISSLNFGSHYGALELGMLGHMSSGAAETPPSDTTVLNPLNQAAGIYNPQMPAHYSERQNMQAMQLGSDAIATNDWQNAQSRQGSIQIQTPHNTPTTAHLDHGRNDSLNGPHAYAIGQGPSSLSSASPASTDVNAGFDNDNPMANASFFANSGQQQRPQRSPTVGRGHQDTALQPIQPNRMPKRRRETAWVYDITKPYDYVNSFHCLLIKLERRFRNESYKRVIKAIGNFRPPLIQSMSRLDFHDLIFQEKNLQRSIIDLEDKFSEVGVPSLICRRSGEVVGMNKEFSILTGWERGVLLGKEPNLNVNTGIAQSGDESGVPTQTSTTPTIASQQHDNASNKVFVVELMDERSSLEFFEDFAELAFLNTQGCKHRRINMLRYRTQEDVDRLNEAKANAITNGKGHKPEPLIKLEGGPVHRGEAAMSNQLGAKDGLVDAMLSWHIKRDNFDAPMLMCMHIMPVLDQRW